MSLNGMMRTGVSGMAGQASRLATVADNIANANTTGYKRVGNAFFSQVVDSDTGVYVPGSLGNVVYNEISRQGPIRGTTSPTDLAISGSGFFVVQGGGENYLTRAGSFAINSDGYLVNGQDKFLMGYDLTNGTSTPVANGFGGLSQINVGSQELEAIPTTLGTFVPNLDDREAVIAAGDLPAANYALGTVDYTSKSSLIVYNSLGGEQLVDVYFSKSATNTWEVAVFDAADATSGGFPYATAPLTSQSLSFDATTGKISGGVPPTLTFTVPNGVSMDLSLEGISQLSTEYTVIDAQANGSAPASIERVEVDGDGTVYGIFENGYSQALYQVALANVASPDNLRKVAGTAFAISIDSGDVLVGKANTAGYGQILSGSLEESNVDMATELTIMIESQRSYTANSKVFQTGAELMEVLVNLSR